MGFMQNFDGGGFVFDGPLGPVTFTALAETGWSYSVLNEVNVIEEAENIAVVKYTFSRFTEDDVRYLNGTSVVALLKVGGEWHIKTGVNFSPILITIDD